MSAFFPARALGLEPEPDHPKLRQRPRSPDEQRERWAARAAQWRARELAEACFGSVSGMELSGLRGDGPIRGLLRLDVPFSDLVGHREREARFLAAAGEDPILASVPFVYVIGPAGSGGRSRADLGGEWART